MNSAIAGAVLASVAAGGLAYVFVYPLLSGDARAEKRQKALVESGPERRIDRISAVNRRDQVAQSLKELEARQKARHKVSIEARITQAGLTWTKRKFFIISALALTYLSSPSYIELLWTTQTGKIALVVSGMWMATGVFVMKKMIAFDF